MTAAKKYFREQFRLNKLTLNHNDASDFYLGCWQSGQSPVPLFCVRFILFLGCAAILSAAMNLTRRLEYWPIHLTSWGVVLITVATGCALLVSFVATIEGSIDSDRLPWYIKLYWAMYCMTCSVAFLITIFYYVLLYPIVLNLTTDDDYIVRERADAVMDLFVHGINSVVMFVLVITARHPIHLYQFLYPFLCTIVYLAFSIIYYYAGGISPRGDVWIYPMLDWSDPGPTTGVVFAIAAFLLVLHVFVMCISALRDYLTRGYSQKGTNFTINQ